MGEVYRARDTRLDRTVAIKVLPTDVSADPELKQRFEREARSISSLQHPHICTLHDIGSQDGTDFLVMEYLEGETLADRLTKGPLKVEEGLKISVEIADALAKAHRQGIVHRDLKPGNIMLTKSGAKLMDFGLAKPTAAIAAGAAGNTTANTPTVSVRSLAQSASTLTQKGTVVGTLQYMAPEVLQGAEADARSDVFSFGCVLYEMIAGRRAFEGKSQASVLAAILEKEPDPVSFVQPLTPPALDYTVRTCLAKDPEERYATAHDLKLQLTWLSAERVRSIELPRQANPGVKRYPKVVVGAVALLAFAAAGYLAHRSPQATGGAIVSEITPPANLNFAFTDLNGVAPALSPDGRELAFAAAGSDGTQRIYVRSLDSNIARPLDGTEDATSPFWSSDGRYLAFYSDGKLKKIEVRGGPPLDICNAARGRGGSWAQDGTILMAPFSGGLSRVSAGGGIPRPVTHLDTSKGETSNRWPQFLPDGRHFLFYVVANSPDSSGTYVGSLEGDDPKLLMRGGSNAIYALPGYLLFVRGGNLMAQKFEAKRFELTGDPVVIAKGVTVVPTNYRTIVSASDDGVLAFWSGASAGSVWPVVWFNRGGKEEGTINASDLNSSPRLSPNGRFLALSVGNTRTNSDIWVHDLSRGVGTRLTFNPAPDLAPIWSPDGSRIAFASHRAGRLDIYVKAANGAGTAQILVGDMRDKVPLSWSPDGRYLAYSSLDGTKSAHDIWMLPMFGDRRPFPFRQGPFDEAAAAFSPDSKWLAYSSDESGRYEVYVVPFPEGSGKWQISTNGGNQPVWRRDGKELFYIAGDNTLMAVAATQREGSLQVGGPRPLFKVHFPGSTTTYDVAPDGNKFVAITYPISHDGSQPVTLVVNWPALLGKHP